MNPTQAPPAPASPRPRVLPRRAAALAVLTAACLLVGVGSAGAELRRTTVTDEFGPDGTSATSFPGHVQQIDYNDANDQLVVMTDTPREIFTFDVDGPGSLTPVPGGHFPAGGSGAAGMAVSPVTGKVYVASKTGGLFGYTPTGTLLPNFPVTGFPLTTPIKGGGYVCGVSVNSEGDLILGNPANGRLEILDAAGNPLRGIDFAVHFPCLVQVDRANDDVYIAGEGEAFITHLIYAKDYEDVSSSIDIFAVGPSDFAVDPLTRDVLSSGNSQYPEPSGTHEFQEFDLAGKEVNSIRFQSKISGIAVGSDGTAYLGLGDKVGEIPFAPVPAVDTREPVGPSEVSGFVDPDGEGAIVDCHIQWGQSPDYWLNTNETPCDQAIPFSDAQPITAQLPGLTPGQTYHYRVVAGNGNNGGVGHGADKTITSPLVADLKTEAATGVTRNSATLNGSFTGNGSNASYYFKWAQNPDFLTNNAPASPAGLGSPSGHTPVSVDLPGLQPQTTYYYRVVVTNGAGTSEGLLKSFTTQQYVIDTTTKPATGLSQDGVTLNGEFFGTGEPVEYYFEWGPTAAYGSKVPGTPVDAGAPNGATLASAQLTEFEGSGTYHYRLVATNSLGTSYGADETFTALVAPLPSIDNTDVSSVGSESATFGVEITPNRKATISIFEYGPSTDYGSFTAVGGPIPGVPNEAKSVSVEVDDLTPGTVYHYRAVATNFSGTSYGPDRTFRTAGPPEIDLVSVSSVGATSASVSALVRPNLRDTTVHFDYGTTGAYGSRTVESGSVGGDQGQHSSGATLSDLTPEMTYHFRVVATNELGVTVSTEQTFKTSKAQTEKAPPPAGKKCKVGFVKRRGRCVKKRRHRHHRKSASGHGRG